MPGPATLAWLAVCLAGIALSMQSIRFTASRAPWTAAGWLATIGYFVAAAFKAAAIAPPLHLEYWFIGALCVLFAVAGVRDEPQAEPWWWPTHTGTTRAQRHE